ncbi:MAG: putative porin [Chitinophagaceae bacterium]
MNRYCIYIFILACSLWITIDAHAQIRPRPRPDDPISNPNRPPTGGAQTGNVKNTGQGTDSLKHRTGLEDSITITFRYLDSSRLQRFDSSLHDFRTKFPVPATYNYIGNTGNAARSLVFTPLLQAGWDPGFHAYDVYKYNVSETRFYNTTRPYAEIGYLLGSKSEQIIHLMHTQNVKPNWNFAAQYRLVNSPGFFQNQNTNHNSYRFNSYYQSPNKRYSNFFIIVANKINSSENGGIRTNINYLDSSAFKERSGVPVKLGLPGLTNRNFFSTKIPTGTRYNDFNLVVRQQYDIGQKDSLVLDTTVIPLFYPRLRFEHTFRLSNQTYRFEDANPDSSLALYRQYGVDTAHPFYLQDRWREVMNDFSIYTFPDKKNPQQFLKLGAALQNLAGKFDSSKSVGERPKTLFNFFVHGEYRNRTRNQKWDIEALGNFYVAGNYAGDYDAFISLKRLISRQIGFLQAGFRNVNRTPSFVFDPASSFWKQRTAQSFNKENISAVFASIERPQSRLRLSGNYYLITNYTYFKSLTEREQESGLFNLLQVTLEKQFTLYKNWQWRTMVVLQQKAGAAPVNVPLVFTRNQIGYEGNLGFRNLRTAFGLEARYHTPYKADGYSPFLGQFYYQDTTRIDNMPDLSLYVHFRIKTFTAYVRGENLNTYRFAGDNTGFTNNNFAAPDYPLPGLQVRVGIFWSFVN